MITQPGSLGHQNVILDFAQVRMTHFEDTGAGAVRPSAIDSPSDAGHGGILRCLKLQHFVPTRLSTIRTLNGNA